MRHRKPRIKNKNFATFVVVLMVLWYCVLGVTRWITAPFVQLYRFTNWLAWFHAPTALIMTAICVVMIMNTDLLSWSSALLFSVSILTLFLFIVAFARRPQDMKHGLVPVSHEST